MTLGDYCDIKMIEIQFKSNLSKLSDLIFRIFTSGVTIEDWDFPDLWPRNGHVFKPHG
jgi:hypothetical protein